MNNNDTPNHEPREFWQPIRTVSKPIKAMYPNMLKGKRAAYILTGTPWNQLVGYIWKVERMGITCTNTAFNEWEKEIDAADYLIVLRGWNETAAGRMKAKYAKQKEKVFKQFDYLGNAN